MGRGTRADGAIVLAYRQGGADGPVRAESREPTLGSWTGAFWLLPCVPPCPVFSQLHGDEDGEAPREPVFVQVVGGRAGWDEETEEKHANIVHSSANTRALRLSPLILLPSFFPHLSRCAPPGTTTRS